MIKIIEQTPGCVIRFLDEDDYDSFVAGYRNCLPSKNRFDDGRIDVSFLTIAILQRSSETIFNMQKSVILFLITIGIVDLQQRLLRR